MTLPDIFKTRLNELMGSMTAYELAQKSNVDISSIYRFKAGTMLPNMKTVDLLARALKVPAYELLKPKNAESRIPGDLLKLLNEEDEMGFEQAKAFLGLRAKERSSKSLVKSHAN